ncbi:MAG: glycosyltransferase family 2 protein [Planctomycetes bacterium]|nr:glycosyltransferase family 2 protein [Planctomycetota bacterium]
MESAGIFAVVANWNGGEENLECLRSLVAQELPEERIVFVDNGSSDGSLALVRARHPRLRVIENASNLGFGEAANQGARLALELGARAVFFVNNDVVAPPGTLAQLAAALEARPTAGIVGPRVLYKSDPSRVWCAGGELTWRENLSTLRGHLEPDGPTWRESRAVDYVPGCALLARRALLERIGMFDAEYFAYMEDVDLCLRARRAGFEVWLVGDAAVEHATSAATGGGYNPRRKYMMGVNSIWFLRRHARAGEWLRFFVFDVLSLPLLWIAGLFRGRGKAVLAKGLGILDGLRGKRVTAEAIRAGAGWLW